MWSDLPPEILRIIFLKLSVKSLIKCTALSKHHRSMITNPELIDAHIKNTITSSPSPTHLFLRYMPDNRSREKFVLAPDDELFSGFDFEAASKLPFDIWPFDILRGGWFNVLGSINGVICLANDLHRDYLQYVLWNPLISKYVELPRPHHVHASGGTVSGFIFDPVSQDYKVVRVVDSRIRGRDPKPVEVFSMRSWCWKDLGTFDLRYQLRVGSHAEYRSCFTQGCVNWVVCDRRGPLIMTFSMSSEVFGVIGLPGGLNCNIEEADGLQIEECRGMLGLSHRNRLRGNCSLWVMKEYGVVGSWTKILDLNIHNVHILDMPRAFEILRSEEIMIVYRGTFRSVLVAVDTTNGTKRTLGEVSADFDSFCLSTYVESLVLFGERKDKQCETASNEQEQFAVGGRSLSPAH